MSPPPIPDRQPTIEGIWQPSPRRSPTQSPRGSPFASPRISPAHTPGGSPSPTRRQSPDDLPPVPRPYTGNSSLLRNCEDSTNDILHTSDLPPLPARNKRIPALPKRNRNTASPILNRSESRPGGSLKDRDINHRQLSVTNSLHRRSRSDDQLDRSWDGNDDFQDATPLQRSFSVSKNKPKCYEPIFNSSSAFLFSGQFSGADEKTISSDSLPDREFEVKPLPNRSQRSSVKLDPNRPVPIPPTSENNQTLQRPTTLSVIVGSRPGSVSDDAVTPTLPPKKNKATPPQEGANYLDNESERENVKHNPSLDGIVNSSSDDTPSPFENDFVIEEEFANKVVVAATSSSDGDKKSQASRKQSEVYYPLLSERMGGCLTDVVPKMHDFYNDDDDEPMKNYEAPVPIVRSPTEIKTTLWSPVSSEGAVTPSTEFAMQTGTRDPFSNDDFFSSKSTNGEEQPPALPKRSSAESAKQLNGVVTAPQEPIDTGNTHDTHVQSMDSPTSKPSDDGETGVTRSAYQASRKFYEQDFEILMRQGYSREAIKRALTVASGNFAIARAILKEFEPKPQ